MLDDPTLARILRYVTGECSAEELPETERWIAEDPARGRAADTLRLLWKEAAAERAGEMPNASASDWDAASAWQRFSDAPPGLAPLAPTRPPRVLRLLPSPATSGAGSRTRVALTAAAACVLAVGSTWLWRIATEGLHEATPTPASQLPVREFTTAPAQRAEIRLADGTTALLAPASRLKVPTAYGASARELELDGEAYFDVRHDPAHPFRVHTARGMTEDVGTRFGIRAYTGDSTERVAVVEGAVLVRAENDQARGARVSAGQLALLAPGGAASVQAVPDIARYVAWTEGRLVFRNTPLRDLATQLGRWYGLDVRIAEPALGRLLFTGSFRDESVTEVLRSLEIALDIRARREGDVVTLGPAHIDQQ